MKLKRRKRGKRKAEMIALTLPLICARLLTTSQDQYFPIQKHTHHLIAIQMHSSIVLHISETAIANAKVVFIK